jgi:hypothetical protein
LSQIWHGDGDMVEREHAESLVQNAQCKVHSSYSALRTLPSALF